MAHWDLAINGKDLGPIISLTTWICMGVMCITVLGKSASKIFKSGQPISHRHLQLDDCFLTIAMIMAVVEGVAVSLQVQSGGGKHVDALTLDEVQNFAKTEYASYLTYSLAMGMTKLATLFYMSTFTNSTAQWTVVWSLVWISILWTIVAFLTLAFQCPLPETWTVLADSCIDQRRMWIGIESLNVFVELNVAVMPLWLLNDMPMTKAKKSISMTAFAIRGLTVPALVLRLYYLMLAFNVSDRTYQEFMFTMTTQTTLNGNIILACIPFIQPLLNFFPPSWTSHHVKSAFGYHNGNYDEERSRSSPLPSGPTKRHETEGYDVELAPPRDVLPRHGQIRSIRSHSPDSD